MSTNTHQKKKLTFNAAVFIRRVFPSKLFNRLNKVYGINNNRIKIKYRAFCIFIVLVIIHCSNDTSLRGIASTSNEKGIQLLSGFTKVSHTAVAERLKSIPTTCMEEVLNALVKEFKKRLKHKSPFLKGMKVFDVTTFSVSAKNYDWVAKRQSRGNLRFLFVMDSYSGTPDAIIDASKNLNDNTMFSTAIEKAKRGMVFVFDKGFNSFRVLKQIIEDKKHFITSWKKNYKSNLLLERKINPNEKLEGNWVLESDQLVTIGNVEEDTELTVRKISCRETTTQETFIIMTDERNWAANKVVKMYVYRWPIEVLFRHIKTNLNIVHFPSRDPNGVRNWMMFVYLSILVIQLLTLEGRSDHTISLLARNSSFKNLFREARVILRNWMFESPVQVVE